jgi:heme oxygenase (biliverdin-producing, ferredoxin)
MTTLKELTWEHHKNAERQDFVKVLMSGNIDPKLYAIYLYNQHHMYNVLEVVAMSHGLFDGIPEVRRAPRIHADFIELWGDEEHSPPMLDSTKKYLEHIMIIGDDAEKLMAHVYVRHMGDLSGGQMIKRKIPGKGTMYEFDGDIAELKDKIRSKLNDSMADEAKLTFEHATKTFQDMIKVKDDLG